MKLNPLTRSAARPRTALVLALACLLSGTAPARGALPTPDADNGGIELPPGFRAVVVADDLGRLRFLAVAGNGDVYVKTREDGIIALRDTNGDGRADVKETFGSGGGTGIAIRDGWLYHSSNSAIYRYKMTPGELVPSGEPQTIVSGLPDGRQHNSKGFAFDDQGRLYVEVGSPSNAYGGEKDRQKGAKGEDPTEFLKRHGGFWRFDPDKPNQTQADGFHFSTGHRHMIGVAWNPVSKALFATMHGRDQLSTVAPEHYSDEDNAEKPAEEMHVIREGASFGWPFTYYDPIRKARMVGPEFGGDNQKKAEPGKYPDPLIAFPGHWAPMQLAFYRPEQFPAKYRGGAFLAFHGSWNRAPKPQKGYNVTFIPFDEKGMPKGTHEVFAHGFPGVAEVSAPKEARFRPCGLAVGPDGSLYVTDSQKGRVWRIFYAGAKKTTSSPPATGRTGATKAAAADLARGADVYQQACSVCHMPDGSGVPGLQPGLLGSPVVAGNTSTLIRVLLHGPAKVLPTDRGDSSNTMPSFEDLTDAELASVVNYVRHTFAKKTASITPSQVATLRKN